jgi:hypothetical protein
MFAQDELLWFKQLQATWQNNDNPSKNDACCGVQSRLQKIKGIRNP